MNIGPIPCPTCGEPGSIHFDDGVYCVQHAIEEYNRMKEAIPASEDHSIMYCNMHGTPVSEDHYSFVVYRGGVDLAGVEIEYGDPDVRMEVNEISFERHGNDCVIIEADLKAKFADVHEGSSVSDAGDSTPFLLLTANERTIKYIGDENKEDRHRAMQTWRFPCLRGWEVFLCEVNRYTLRAVFRRLR